MNDIDKILDGIRGDEPTAAQTEEAAARVRRNLFGQAGAAAGESARITGCADYRSLFPAYVSKSLSDARRMLVDDHIRECGACRKALDEARGGRGKVAPFVAPARRAGGAPQYHKWAVAAGMFAAVGTSSWGILKWLFPGSGNGGAKVASIQNIDGGKLYRGDSPLAEGREIAARESIRTPIGTRAVVRLGDGSLIEVNERSELSVSRDGSGTTIRLERGSIIVQAAKQRSGSLMVSTGDALVSVKGTIFSVNRGVKGSRVLVVEGSVRVEQQARGAETLKPGDQTTTDPSLGKVAVADEVAWSKDSARYLAMLSELSALGRKLDQIPGPGLRYSSKLLPFMPQGTVLYAAIPNIGNAVGEAKRVFDDHLKESPALRDWWQQSANASARAEVDEVIRDIQRFASFIGDEVVITLGAGGKRPLAMAEIRKEGIEVFIQDEIRKRAGGGAGGPVQGKDFLIHKNTLIFSDSAAAMADVAAALDRGAAGDGGAFGQRIAQAYESGAGWLLCADMERIVKDTAVKGGGFDFGVDNAKFLVIERKEMASKAQNIASLSFSEQRKGLMAWLGAPSPMSSLDFVSPDASMALGAVVKNPRLIVEELFAAARAGGRGFDINLAEIEAKTGLKMIDDLAAPLGSEFAIASDGPVLQGLGWKVAMEMYAPRRFQDSVEKLVEVYNQDAKSGGKLTLSASEADGRAFHAIAMGGLPFEIHYTYVDGYLLAGANRALLLTAIKNRANGYVLTRAEKFRSQLPFGANPNFSAVVYHNVGSALGPAAEQLKAAGYRGLDGVQDMAPGVVAIHGEPTRITAATEGGFGILQLLGNRMHTK